MGPSPRTAAHSFLSIRNYIETTYGAGSFRKVRESIVEAFPDFPQVLVPGAWYPTPMLMAVVMTAKELFGPEDFYERCGRAIVKYEVNVFLRFALRLSTPWWVVDKAGDAWHQAHSTGTWDVTAIPGEINARLLSFDCPPEYCRMLTSYFQELLGLSGVKDLRVEHRTCRGRGDTTCLFVVRWRER